MPHTTTPSVLPELPAAHVALERSPSREPGQWNAVPDPTLPLRITRSASKQAYYTVRFLVDRDRRLEAFRAYAYFRWVDDLLDGGLSQQSDRLRFIARQQSLVESGYRGEWPDNLTAEEQMLAALVQGDDEPYSGLRSYVGNMMAVMTFDANRRGRLISSEELNLYTRWLATAVTDALHYFIGHDRMPPSSAARYLPAMAAHITHMLRDTVEDIAAGYFNVPRELLQISGNDPQAVESAPYRDWVKSRVALARSYFTAGAAYLDQVPSLRCRLAGYAYMARFVGILDAIEREGYRLRPAYPEFKRVGYGLRVGGSVCARALLRGTP